MTIALIIFFALCIGSFLNVCIYRIPRKLSIRSPRRSFCPKCENQLSILENIPVVSWIILRAKCRHCGQSISGQYPLVELLSAFFALESYLHFGLNPTGVLVYLLCATLIVITFIDLEFKIIPDIISFPGMIIGLGISVLAEYTKLFSVPITEGALDSLLGMLAGGGFFYLLAEAYWRIAKKSGLGGGDIKLMGFVGALLGLKSITPTIFAGSLFGAVFGIAMIILRGGNRNTEIPFGPWLSLGVLVYVFFDFYVFKLF